MDLIRLNTTKFLKTGDRGAFTWLYLHSEGKFKQYAKHLTGGRYAEDLIQLTCLQVLQYNGREKDPAEFNFASFFARSLHNTFLDLCRRNHVITHELHENCVIVDEEYEERNLKPLLSCVEEHLTPTQKQVIYLRMQGIKYRHIAIIMGININTARGIFRYAQKTLVKYEKRILEL